METMVSVVGIADSEHATDRSEATFAALVERQARLMFRVAQAVLRNREDAEDAVQEAFLKLYRLGGWEMAKKERAYVAQAVWRVAIDRVTNRGSRRESSLVGEDGAMREITATGRTAEEEVSSNDERVRLRSLIGGLPEELRQPLLLCAIEEMTSREVAEVMGIPEGTVRTRVMRAKDELRRRFVAASEGRRQW